MMKLSDIRDSFTPEDIKNILFDYQVYPISENDHQIVFPTCCHNLDGGSPKLYYYLDTHLFVCYTHCNASFDIFELIIKMEKLRGTPITLKEAIAKCGVTDTVEIPEDRKDDIKSIEYIKKLKMITPTKLQDYEPIDEKVLDQYVDMEEYLQPWIDEGMTTEALHRFGIKYDMVNIAIAIPHRDRNGNLIGVRGRFMAEDAPNKYMPLNYRGKFLNHSLKNNLYGLYENKEVIERKKTVFIFESEKSVILMESYFGKENNNAVATCGNKISKEQILLLQKAGVTEVILCYDKDYDSYAKMKEIQEKYEEIGERLSNYFRTSIIMDQSMLLNYKDSPIDEGKDVFMELYKYRYYV